MFETTKQIYIYMYPTWYSHSISIIQYITYLPLFTQFTALSLGVFGATHHDLQHQLTYPTGPLEWSHQLTCPLNSHKQNWLVVYLHAGPLGTTGSDWIDKSEGYHLIRVTGWWLTYPSEKQSQLGWWHSQLNGQNKMFQSTNQKRKTNGICRIRSRQLIMVYMIRISIEFSMQHNGHRR